jgi:hypothetical protein
MNGNTEKLHAERVSEDAAKGEWRYHTHTRLVANDLPTDGHGWRSLAVRIGALDFKTRTENGLRHDQMRGPNHGTCGQCLGVCVRITHHRYRTVNRERHRANRLRLAKGTGGGSTQAHCPDVSSGG